ncbi:YqhA family protein [Ruegeria sp. 2205SS24-7]|uniref:YqhA family protein n=1 Tax=Ruegeria discodermiae TaxID=3064389 RepID=UPI0027428150|nr:YqhA family protein [Ruegeria sp. 2205SS24-7]MDP5218899.1 YqhA family protein [Ruegeria sp. 2205SS24-7]
MSGEFEKAVQHGVSASRWLLAPMYLGLALLLIVLLIQFVRDFFDHLPVLFQTDALNALPIILSLGIVLLAANIVLSILHTSYELFIPGLRAEEGAENRRSEVDFTRLRNRFLAIAVALSLLLLLKEMLIYAGQADDQDTRQVLHLAAMTGLLVLFALVLAIADWFLTLARR